jgi:predicted nucleic acid-binding protein
VQATIIVSSDQDLLMLHPFHGIVILTAAEFCLLVSLDFAGFLSDPNE